MENFTHTSFSFIGLNFIIESFIRFARKLDCFKEIDKKNYIIWTDTGSHFRCSEFLHYLFKGIFC